MKLNRKLKMGMVGGGPGAFIGEVHRKAARLDGGIELVAGAFDINLRKSKQMRRELDIAGLVKQNLDDGLILSVSYVGISFPELVRDDTDDVSILVCEMINETGPDFVKPIDANDFVTILGSYAKYMENKHLASLLRIFCSYNPEKVFTTASETLSNAKGSQKEVANDIWRVGEEIMLFRLKAPKLLPSGIILYKYRKAPEELLSDIKEALGQSQKAPRLFEEKPTLENAVKSCEANRKTLLLLFPARSSYNISQNKLFVDFQGIVRADKDSKENRTDILPDDPRNEFLKIIAESEKRRLGILDAIRNNNMYTARNLMCQAIEEAYRISPMVPETCSNLDFVRITTFLIDFFCMNVIILIHVSEIQFLKKIDL